MTSPVSGGLQKPSNSVYAIEQKSIFLFETQLPLSLLLCRAEKGRGGLCCSSLWAQPGWWRCRTPVVETPE